jgi:hypothetical protein
MVETSMRALLRGEPADAALHDEIAAVLRDEFADIQRTTRSEIRSWDEVTSERRPRLLPA